MATLALVVMTLSACATASGGAPGTTGASSGEGAAGTLTLVAYSTPREVYEAVIPMFGETDAGRGTTFEQSYGASGEQSRAVEAGLPADVVAFSLAPDVDRLVAPGLVPEGWADDGFEGMVSRSVVVLAVRPGNPKGIEGWEDLLRDDVEIVTPNPFTSGGAKWNVMAAYGYASDGGSDQQAGVDYLRGLYANVSVQDKSAREALQTFLGGKGDVLLAYENEAITAQQKDEQLEYVVPDATILIENPIAVTADSDVPARAQAFIDFLRSPEAQQVFAEKGYRPVLDSVEADFPEPASLFTIADLGGWTEVNASFFDNQTGIMAEIERSIGVEP